MFFCNNVLTDINYSLFFCNNVLTDINYSQVFSKLFKIIFCYLYIIIKDNVKEMKRFMINLC